MGDRGTQQAPWMRIELHVQWRKRPEKGEGIFDNMLRLSRRVTRRYYGVPRVGEDVSLNDDLGDPAELWFEKVERVSHYDGLVVLDLGTIEGTEATLESLRNAGFE